MLPSRHNDTPCGLHTNKIVGDKIARTLGAAQSSYICAPRSNLLYRSGVRRRNATNEADNPHVLCRLAEVGASRAGVQRRLHLNLVHDIGEQNPHASHKNGPENCRFLSDMSGSSLEVHLRVMLDCIVVGHLLTISNETADCQLIFFLRNSCSVTCYKIIKVCTRVHSL